MKDLIESFFYRAMRQGYAAESTPISTIAELPGSKVIAYQEGMLKIIDCWFANRNGKSFGNTIIFNDNKPIWNMHYWGWYNKEVIPFLKRALAADYYCNRIGSVTEFRGCRGPKLFTGTHDTYVNIIEDGSSFDQFSGREEIFSRDSGHTVLGWHRYHGCIF